MVEVDRPATKKWLEIGAELSWEIRPKILQEASLTPRPTKERLWGG